MEAWSLNTLLLVFGGGIFGAAFGALWSIILCALIILVGCGVVLSGGSDFLLLSVGLGPIFGPHVGGFASGIAAATYAAGYRKNHPSGTAKDILSPLLDTSWDVLAVGGIFALFGHALLQLVGKVPVINQFDTLALVVVVSNVFCRLLFQKEAPWGNMESIKKIGYLKTDNYSISWAPWQAVTSRHVILGLGVGLLSGATAIGLSGQLAPMVAKGAISPVAAFVVPLIIGWALAIISLIPLNLAVGSIQKVPIVHAMAILAALAALYSGSIVVAGIVGVLAALLQELMARMFYNHGSNQIDPPAAAIMFGTFVLNLLFKPEFLNLGQLFK